MKRSDKISSDNEKLRRNIEMVKLGMENIKHHNYFLRKKYNKLKKVSEEAGEAQWTLPNLGVLFIL